MNHNKQQKLDVDRCIIRVLQYRKHTNSGYIMPEIVKNLLVRPMACIKEIIRLVWILSKRSLRLEAVYW